MSITVDNFNTDLYLNLPDHQRACDFFGPGNGLTDPKHKDEAISKSYISYNPALLDRVDYLLIDCDHDRFDHVPPGMPIPNITVKNRVNGKHHHIYRFETPVLTGSKAKPQPHKKLRLIRDAANWSFGGDVNYNQLVAKNAFSPKFQTFYNTSDPVEFSHFNEIVDSYRARENRTEFPKARYKFSSQVEYDGSWNTFAFHKIRLLAKECSIFDWYGIQKISEQVNCEIADLDPVYVRSEQELDTIAFSIYRYYLHKKNLKTRTSPILNLSSDLTGVERQAAGAAHASQQKAQESMELVSEAAQLLTILGGSDDIVMKIVLSTGLTVNTVKSCLKELDIKF